jgi:uncharacterized protein
LEMGTRLATDAGKNLYQFWGNRIASYLNDRAEVDGSGVLVNLASEEYFKSVDRSVLKPKVVTCVFEEQKNGQTKVISFMAKRARGLMVRFAAENRVKKPADLTHFETDGYAYITADSNAERLVFRRSHAAA